MTGVKMASQSVNLDALIPREDFEARAPELPEQASVFTSTLTISDLGLESFTYSTLRKPDFQRETANWTPEKVADLVKNFLEGDLIPAVILWHSNHTGNIFVIDGAHRLSALIAWVQDDYGDQQSSLKFFDNIIPDEQRRAAEATRKLIRESVGSYNELKMAMRNPGATNKYRNRLARNAAAFAIQLQWVKGEAEKAETSFFRINQQATPIDDGELDMIKSRRKPNALAARAFIRAGTGHKYWSAFDQDVQADIERIAKEVFDLIFRPNLEATIRTADLPVAGRGYSADSIKMVFGLVNFVNDIDSPMWTGLAPSRRRRPVGPSRVLEDDLDGATTLKCMQAVRRTAARISGKEPGSLGLHPAVYFYSATGRFQPSSFLATVGLVKELETQRKFADFTRVRADFENFLVQHKYFLNQIVHSFG
ncbi:DUF262 domain-containing protein, partial [Frankia sp. AgB32]|uniref:DUF262 domain-containing protein n=1 Tax=Frankia sp. AgB32 TaxID=631119 RepID=UPI00200DA9A3